MTDGRCFARHSDYSAPLLRGSRASFFRPGRNAGQLAMLPRPIGRLVIRGKGARELAEMERRFITGRPAHINTASFLGAGPFSPSPSPPHDDALGDSGSRWAVIC